MGEALKREFIEWVKKSVVSRWRYGDFICTEQHEKGGLSFKKATLRIEAGEWPSDADLLSLVDGDNPPLKRHWGGSVTSLIGDDGWTHEKRIVVNTD